MYLAYSIGQWMSHKFFIAEGSFCCIIHYICIISFNCRSNMGGSTEWDNRMMDSLKNFDLSSPEIKQQFGELLENFCFFHFSRMILSML